MTVSNSSKYLNEEEFFRSIPWEFKDWWWI